MDCWLLNPSACMPPWLVVSSVLAHHLHGLCPAPRHAYVLVYPMYVPCIASLVRACMCLPLPAGRDHLKAKLQYYDVLEEY